MVELGCFLSLLRHIVGMALFKYDLESQVKPSERFSDTSSFIFLHIMDVFISVCVTDFSVIKRIELTKNITMHEVSKTFLEFMNILKKCFLNNDSIH